MNYHPDAYADAREDLPALASPTFEIMYDQRPKQRRYTKSVRTAMDTDMFQAIQDLLMDKRLPYSGDIGAFGRDAWASKIKSLEQYLTGDGKTVWASLQATQRRLTAERYVVLIEEQVKETADLLAAWTMAGEWDAVVADMEFVRDQLEELPSPAWRRRLSKEWLSNQQVRGLLDIWAADMEAASLERVNRVWEAFRRYGEGG